MVTIITHDVFKGTHLQVEVIWFYKNLCDYRNVTLHYFTVRADRVCVNQAILVH